MFRKTYDSLSMNAHVELLVDAEKLCLKTWIETDKKEFDEINANQEVYEDGWKYNFLGSNCSVDMENLSKSGTEKIHRSLKVPYQPEHLQWPAEVTGIYHRYLPCGKVFGKTIKGEEFLKGMPEAYKDEYKDRLTGKYFMANAYSWIDLTDPTISTGERTDGSCWVIGIDYGGYSTPAFNAIPRERNTKAHPMRSARQYGSPASLFVYRPFSDTPLDECSITLKYNKGYGFSSNVDNWVKGTDEKEILKSKGTDSSGNPYDYIGQLKEAFPSFEITSGGGDIKKDAVDTVEFKMVDVDGKLIKKDVPLFLEVTGGYLPKQRVTTKDGKGSFKVKALALDAGDEFKVKIGFRDYTGMADVEYKVTK